MNWWQICQISFRLPTFSPWVTSKMSQSVNWKLRHLSDTRLIRLITRPYRRWLIVFFSKKSFRICVQKLWSGKKWKLLSCFLAQKLKSADKVSLVHLRRQKRCCATQTTTDKTRFSRRPFKKRFKTFDGFKNKYQKVWGGVR